MICITDAYVWECVCEGSVTLEPLHNPGFMQDSYRSEIAASWQWAGEKPRPRPLEPVFETWM